MSSLESTLSHQNAYRIPLLSWILSFLTLASNFSALAQTDSKTMPIVPDTKFQIIETQGQPTRLVAEDGREAEMNVAYTDILEAKTPIQVTENLCHANAAVPKCSWVTSVRMMKAQLIWTKNSNPDRLGKALRANGIELSENIFTSSFYVGPARKFLGIDGNDPLYTRLDRLECDDFSWLIDPNTQSKEPHEIVMLSGQSMVGNEETGINENQTTSVAYNLKLTPQQNALAILPTDKVAARGFTRFSAFSPALSQASMLIQKNELGENCQISMTSSLAIAAGTVLKLAQLPLSKPVASDNVRMKDLFAFRLLNSSSGLETLKVD